MHVFATATAMANAKMFLLRRNNSNNKTNAVFFNYSRYKLHGNSNNNIPCNQQKPEMPQDPANRQVNRQQVGDAVLLQLQLQ